MDYNLSKKVGEKWVNFGSVKKNQYGNLQASFRNTPELRELILQGGEWINFSMFEKKDKLAESKAPAGYARPKADNSLTDDAEFLADNEAPF